ncbi:hypothetical protein P43SY_006260 [Pythium insidiosum]|uniref:Uncharacterized protein n=1 Tax=Pythium insidiosum TaxID=114742 RepID=A0AAD5M8R2_PYTIN|nr:hypothetical protein P43SY_006260 [Pythium insidiosum]
MASPVNPGTAAPPLSLHTSEAYVVSGHCALQLSPGATSDEIQAILDVFEVITQYLDRAMLTQNLALLRRMFADYLCARETTMTEFAAFGASLITVTPVRREPDEELPTIQLPTNQLARAREVIRAFIVYIDQRLVVKNAVVLQFLCLAVSFGDLVALTRWVSTPSSANNVPCVLPYERTDTAPQITPSGLEFERPEMPPMPPAPVPMAPPAMLITAFNHPPPSHLSTPRHAVAVEKAPLSLNPSQKRQRLTTNDSLWVGRSSGTKIAGDSPSPSPSIAPESAMSPATCERIVQTFQALEKKAPWRGVYPADMPLPVDEQTAPELSAKLRLFWRQFARAVWERSFWAPLSKHEGRAAYAARRSRQQSASNMFGAIMRQAYRELGAEFFVRLERARHPGWWYRGAVVSMEEMYLAVGEDAMWDYVRSQYRNRFPNSDALVENMRTTNIVRLQQTQRVVSPAMWLQSMDDEALEMKRAVQAARQAMDAQRG